MVISMPNEECVRKLMRRSVMIRSCFELWGRSTTKEHLDEQLKALPTEVTTPYFNKEKTFKVVVDIFNKVISQREKVERIEVIILVPFPINTILNIFSRHSVTCPSLDL